MPTEILLGRVDVAGRDGHLRARGGEGADGFHADARGATGDDGAAA
ncbi:hypothetical protein [Lentzea aerocolonigenes]